MKIFLKILASIALICVFFWGLKRILMIPSPCRTHCGFSVEELVRDARSGVYSSQCPLLSLDLELAKPEARANRRYSLWYKATVTNISCLRLEDINAGAFIDSEDMSFPNASSREGSGLFLRVWGPDGKLVESSVAPRFVAPEHPAFFEPESLTEFADVTPYEIDFGEIAALRKRGLGDYNFMKLDKGDSLHTVQSIRAPRRFVRYDEREPGSISSGLRSIPVPEALKHIRPAPPGFRILDRYVFAKPGDYKIQAVYHGDSLMASSTLLFERILPARIWRILDGVLGLSPAFVDIRVHAESQVLKFHVKP